MKEINDKLNYGYSELELLDIIHAVGGYNHETISFEKFNQHIKRKVAKRKSALLHSVWFAPRLFAYLISTIRVTDNVKNNQWLSYPN